MRQHHRRLSLALAALAPFVACKQQGEDASDGAETSVEKAMEISPGASSLPAKGKEALSELAKYDKGMTKKGCELLTAEDVSKAFAVPADKLRTVKVMGCIYSWKDGDQVLEARISMLMAHKSELRAANWFKNATANTSAADAQKAMDDAMKQVRDKAGKGELGKQVTTGAVDTVAKGLTGAVDPKGNRYEDMASLGDEARIQLENGAIWIRVDNLTFTVSGYKGTRQPKSALPTGDLKALAAKAQEDQRAWLSATYAQRKTDGIKVAKIVLAAL